MAAENVLNKQEGQLLEILTATPERAAPTDANPRSAGQCSVHVGKELELYCKTCGELICWKCAAKGSKHRDHDYEELEQAFEKCKMEIASLLEPMEKQVMITKKTLTKLDAYCGEISNQRAATAINVHTTFTQLREFLDVRETELISQLDTVTQSKLNSLAAQRNQIETTLAQQSSCVHFMRGNLGSQKNTLMMKTDTVRQVKELTTSFQLDHSQSFEETASCIGAECWKILALTSLDPSKCKLDGILETATAGEKRSAILHAATFNGELYKECIEALECSLVSEISGTTASCSVERRGQGQYEISYQPAIKGRHQLHVKVLGQHVRGSPFGMVVKSPVEKLGTPILTIGRVVEPWGVAINQRGEVVVTEWGDHCVSVFGLNGEKLRSFGARGSNPGQFQHPREVAVDGEGNTLISDSGNHRIQRFTMEGYYSASAGTYGCGHLQFIAPNGIAFNTSNNKVYVGDTWNNRIQVLNSDLTFSGTFGKHGSGMGEFSSPYGVACDSTGKVYVADWNNHRIQVFTAEGKFLRMFGGRGQGVNYPVGVAVDAGGMVYVSEQYKHRVSVFTSEGRFVTVFGREGRGPGEFAYPRGLAVDKNGVVRVCDIYNDRVQVF
jgi:tripartite motif-containing protein 2/3/tripartite motif-containing protein 71